MSSNEHAGAPQIPAKLDRDAFKQVITVPALRVPNRKCNEMMKQFRGFTLDRPKLRCIVHDASSGEHKLLLLEEKVAASGLSPELDALVKSEGLEMLQHDVVMEYGMFAYDQILKRLLPAEVETPGSFETVGHIAHLNLREEQLPYKHLIGQVLLDKNPHLKTIVNKLGSIENEFRVFSMEVIAGEANLETEVTQHGARFKLDFSQVYWNSRLETEHTRLVSSFQPGQVVVDIMAGIGPFAIPSAQRGCEVLANDLNPRSVFYMAKNVRLNKVGQRVKVFNMDGREFVKLVCATPGGPIESLPPAEASEQEPAPAEATSTSSSAAAVQQQPAQAAAAAAEPASEQQQQQQQQQASTSGAAAGAPAGGKGGRGSGGAGAGAAARAARDAQDVQPPAIPVGWRPPPQGVMWHHAVMNLPASAIEFLDAFHGAFHPEAWRGRLPMVHCYTFKRGTETEADVLAKAEGYLGGKFDEPPTVHVVRDVAPNKLMLCLSFRVPEAVAFATSKRAKVDVGEGQ